ncbi:MAG: DUF4389 domain-containing protein [Chloroflexi bacterium]|nr:DUF4389 domain-containing protein [Chloroflexota bacterium]MBV9602450.1 DUF4389 domain-containing protein [Chloroflexota bacterium]
MTLSPPVGSTRFWAVPVLGFLIKLLILIPHLIVIYVLGIALFFAELVIWIPVLFTARYPGWAFGLVAGYLRWVTRLAMYFYGLSDAYPAFSFDAPEDMLIERPESSSRFFAILLVGGIVRYILLIPHYIILYALGIAVAACQLLIWVWVLFGGQYPAWAFTFVGGTITWSTRVYAYFFGLTDRYPPFSFE